MRDKDLLRSVGVNSKQLDIQARLDDTPQGINFCKEQTHHFSIPTHVVF